jgi:hypothetical protein
VHAIHSTLTLLPRCCGAQRLVEGSSEVEETEESAETARAFFRRAQGATSLPQVDQVLESLQIYVCGGSNKK